MTTLILIRHGETDWNRQEIWQGQTDIPLNETGEQQALAMAQRLQDQGIQAIVSSDLRRAKRTAEVLGEMTNLPVLLDERLREINLGDWEGLHISAILAQYPDLFRRRELDPWRIAVPNGESALQVRSRALAAVADIQRRFRCQRVAVVSHGFLIAVLIAEFRPHPFGSLWELVPGNGEIKEIDLPEQTLV